MRDSAAARHDPTLIGGGESVRETVLVRRINLHVAAGVNRTFHVGQSRSSGRRVRYRGPAGNHAESGGSRKALDKARRTSSPSRRPWFAQTNCR